MNSDLPLNESDFTIHFAAKGEGLEYHDAYGVYRFDVGRKGGTYYLQVPGYAGSDSGKRQLSQQEFDRIIPRVQAYLGCEKLFGLFPIHHRVEIVGENVWPA
jgi:hypothetical protein